MTEVQLKSNRLGNLHGYFKYNIKRFHDVVQLFYIMIVLTSACSRRRAELEAEGRVVTLHCTANGDYEPLQCDDGMCWCAQPKTGQPTVSPIPEEDMTRLPCCKCLYFHEQKISLDIDVHAKETQELQILSRSKPCQILRRNYSS